jgi:peptide/nickel transport system permease protein
MHYYVARRLGFLVFVIIGVTLLIFTISHLVPADPARVAAGLNARDEDVEALRKMMGLDQPLYVQYGRYLWGLLHLDFGRSPRSLRPVSSDLAHFLPATIELVIVAMVLYVGIGIPLGVVSAVKQNSLLDRATRLAVIAGVAMPEFWFALILQYVFFAKLGILPSGARLPVGMEAPRHITGMYILDSLLTGNWPALGASLTHILLPAVALAVGRVAILVRIVRRGLISVLREDYIRTSRAKGLTESHIIWRHAFKNVLIPVITIIGLQTGWLLNTSLVVETVFSWPGLGWYTVQSIEHWDFLAVMSVALVVSLGFVFINMTVDAVYAVVDPRVREAT